MMTAMGEANPLTAQDYPQIDNEVLVAIGDRDAMVTLEETIAVYRSLKSASLVVLPETPHPIEKVDCERMAREIIRFFG